MSGSPSWVAAVPKAGVITGLTQRTPDLHAAEIAPCRS